METLVEPNDEALIFEAYCHRRPSEEDAVSYLNDRVVDTMERFKEYFPNVAAGSGMLFGNFNQIPIISLDVNPEVDSKYYLDMQLNLVATHPVFQDLGVTGYWGSYYDDEELEDLENAVIDGATAAARSALLVAMLCKKSLISG